MLYILDIVFFQYPWWLVQYFTALQRSQHSSDFIFLTCICLLFLKSSYGFEVKAMILEIYLIFLKQKKKCFIRFALFWVWLGVLSGLGFRVNLMGGTLFKKSSFVSILALCSERHLASCLKQHFLGILFGRTLSEDCVRKDTFQEVKMKDVLYKLSLINFKMV